MYIIRTDQLLNTFGQSRDFQSCIFKYESGLLKEYEWDCFKSIICMGKTSQELKGSMKGIYIEKGRQ